MNKITYATIEVPDSPVNLGYTQFLKYLIPFDRTSDFQVVLEEQANNMRSLFRQAKEPELFELLKKNEKKICTWRHFRAFEKLNAMIELIKCEFQAGAYKKLVIFAKHRDVIGYLHTALREYGPVTMYEKSNPHKVEISLKNFNTPNHKVRIFICVTTAARTKLLFHQANHMFFAEDDLIPATELQAILSVGKERDKLYVRNLCLDNDSLDNRLQNAIRLEVKRLAWIQYPDPYKETSDVVSPDAR